MHVFYFRADLKRESVRKVIRGVNFPYKLTKQHKILAPDNEQRLEFCVWALGELEGNVDFFKSVLFTDESSFSNVGLPNHQNYRRWTAENQHWTQEVPLQHRWKINVWAGIVADRIVGPFFFEGNLDSRMYAEFLEEHVAELLEGIPLEIRRRMWWQQDGASSHTARIARAILNRQYPGRWIGLRGPISWPPRSPDLTPLDFFLWGHIKNVVYRTPPTTEEDMRQRIVNACAGITPIMLRNVRSNFRKRVDVCIDQDGGHVENV